MLENKFSFNKRIKNFADIYIKVNMIIENYEPKTYLKFEGKKKKKKKIVISLNRIKYALLEYYLNPNIVAELHKNMNTIK